MGALTMAAGLLLIAGGTDAGAEDVSIWAPQIAEASARYGIPRLWIERVMAAESAGHVMRGGIPIRSRAGAIGLMQLMPETWAEMREAEHLGTDPDDPHDNILAGTAYLRTMYNRFGYLGMYAAYNAGPARYAAALSTRQRLPDETLNYLAAVTGLPRKLPKPRRRDAIQSLFVVRHDRPIEPSQEITPRAAGLFVAGGNIPPG